MNRAGLLLALALLIAPPIYAGDPSAVVLMYHRFGEDQHPSTSVSIANFEAHLEHLASAGYSVLPLEHVVEAIHAGTSLPDRTVAITVDDAYRSVFTEAWPRLRARGWPCTVFVSTDAVDDNLRDFMTWEQMRKMQEEGASFGDHTATHAHLLDRFAGEGDSAWLARVRSDIEKGHRRIENELGVASTLFAYPYGEYDHALRELVTKMDYTAFGQESGAVGVHSDLLALPRFPMAEAFAAIDEFKVKVASLPLPVIAREPRGPVTSDSRPRVEISLAASDARLDQLACFVTGQGQVVAQWLEAGKRFAVQAEKSLPAGSRRYNCTAPNQARDRYYWFSQYWIVRPSFARAQKQDIVQQKPSQ